MRDLKTLRIKHLSQSRDTVLQVSLSLRVQLTSFNRLPVFKSERNGAVSLQSGKGNGENCKKWTIIVHIKCG